MVDGPNTLAYVGNGVIARRDHLGLQIDSVSRSLLAAMRRGNTAEIRNILDAAADTLSPALRQRALQRIKDLGTKAGDLIPGRLKRSPSYRSELADETFESLLRQGSEAAKGMCKLIKESPRLLEKF